jgi:teichuronic acid biosynthesis glycosyltransferase TuaG
VSVVIATHQRREQCVRAVKSVLSQTVPPLEVLVCDDGSTDGTAETLSAWSKREPRIRYLRLPRHTGNPASPRNLGLQEARGEWIAFLDDDDNWLPRKLELQLPHLVSEFQVVSSNALSTRGGTYPLPGQPPREFGRHELLLDNWVIMSTAVALRKAVIEVGGFRTDPRLTGLEDYCLWLDLAERGARFLLSPEIVAIYDAAGNERLSDATVRRQAELARYTARRWRSHLGDRHLAAAAFVHASRLVKLALRQRFGRRRRAKRDSRTPR